MQPNVSHPTEDAPKAALAESLRGFHRQFPTGVTVVTAMTPDGPRGLAVNAFCSITLTPPVVLVCVAHSSTTHPHLAGATVCGVSVLAAGQADVAQRFAVSGGDKFRELAWSAGPHGSPLIDGAAARLEAEIDERVEASTHTLFFGRVVHAEATSEPPLVYCRGQLFDPSGLLAAHAAPPSPRGESRAGP